MTAQQRAEQQMLAQRTATGINESEINATTTFINQLNCPPINNTRTRSASALDNNKSPQNHNVRFHESRGNNHTNPPVIYTGHITQRITTTVYQQHGNNREQHA